MWLLSPLPPSAPDAPPSVPRRYAKRPDSVGVTHISARQQVVEDTGWVPYVPPSAYWRLANVTFSCTGGIHLPAETVHALVKVVSGVPSRRQPFGVPLVRCSGSKRKYWQAPPLRRLL